MAAPDSAVLGDLLIEMRGMRVDLRTLSERMAAHPEAADLRQALERVRVLEAREEESRRVLLESRADAKALTTRVEALERADARGGVTITAAHKIAGALLGLIVLAVVWFAGRVTAPSVPDNRPPAAAHP